MALILHGPMVSEARGSVGGVVFSRNQHGAYTRNRTKPVNPNTMRQSAARLRVEQLQQAWVDDLTQDQRDGWEEYASGSPTTNRLGQTTILAGINAFIRTNSLYLLAGGTRIDDAPPFNGTAALPNIAYTADTTDGINVDTVSPAPAAGDAMLFFVSPAKPPTVNFFKSGYVLTLTNVGTLTVPFELKPPAGVIAGQKYFIEARLVTADGRVTSRFQQSIIVA